MKDGLALLEGEIIDGTYMSKKALVAFLRDQVGDAKALGILFSLHMKATMMKVSDPIIFGHAVRVFFSDLFDKHGAELEAMGANPNNGFGDVIARIESLRGRSPETPEEIEAFHIAAAAVVRDYLRERFSLPAREWRATSSSTPPCRR